MRARATDHTVTATEKPTTTTGKAKMAAPVSRHRVPSVTTDHSRAPSLSGRGRLAGGGTTSPSIRAARRRSRAPRPPQPMMVRATTGTPRSASGKSPTPRAIPVTARLKVTTEMGSHWRDR